MKQKTNQKFAVQFLLTTALFASFSIVGCKKEQSDIPSQDPAIDYSMSSSKAGKTGQSIMIDINIPNNLNINETQVWAFDDLAAAVADYGYNSCNPATSGSGNGNSCRSGALSSARNAKCTYWDNDKKFWNLEETRTTGGAEISVTAKIYGLSVVEMKKGVKYSFSLLDSSNVSRITNLEWSTDNSTWTALEHTVVDAANDSTVLDAFYFGNAGRYGNTSLLPSDGQHVYELLNNDGFTGNEGKAQMGQTASFKLPLTEGTTNVYIRGVVKGNSGQSSTNFSIVKSVSVSNGGCN